MSDKQSLWAFLLSVLFLVPVLCAGLGSEEEARKAAAALNVQVKALEMAMAEASKEEEPFVVPEYEEPSEDDLLIKEWHGAGPMAEIPLARTVYRVLETLPHIKDRDGQVHQLVIETARVESWLGHFDYDARCAGGLGAFQMHETSVKDLLKRLPKEASDAVMAHFRKEWTLKENIEHNVPFGIAACASYYWLRGMDKRNISTVQKRGEFWKDKYNTKLGAGTVREYVRRNSF